MASITSPQSGDTVFNLTPVTGTCQFDKSNLEVLITGNGVNQSVPATKAGNGQSWSATFPTAVPAGNGYAISVKDLANLEQGQVVLPITVGDQKS
jgi:hypothetical protein